MAKRSDEIETETGEVSYMRQEFDGLKRKVKAVEEKYEQKIREHPIQHVAIAFGVGIACGALATYLIKRRKE